MHGKTYRILTSVDEGFPLADMSIRVKEALDNIMARSLHIGVGTIVDLRATHGWEMPKTWPPSKKASAEAEAEDAGYDDPLGEPYTMRASTEAVARLLFVGLPDDFDPDDLDGREIHRGRDAYNAAFFGAPTGPQSSSDEPSTLEAMAAALEGALSAVKKMQASNGGGSDGNG